MRDHNDDDRKKPQPVLIRKKGSNAPEIAEVTPWRLTHKDSERDRHRHVV
jgi:hypothetical protein